jgi:hypothetical protein
MLVSTSIVVTLRGVVIVVVVIVVEWERANAKVLKFVCEEACGCVLYQRTGINSDGPRHAA